MPVCIVRRVRLAMADATRLKLSISATAPRSAAVLARHRPNAVMHLAAETHVDRSIDGPDEFVRTNLVGTFELLEAVRAYWSALPPAAANHFRFLHISTDEVFGSLGADSRSDRNDGL